MGLNASDFGFDISSQLPEPTRDVFEGSFMEFAAGESYVSLRERDWLAFVRKAEKLLGHDLDGDQGRNGYSLDYAHDAFSDGLTPAEYVAEVRAEPNYRPA